MSQHLSLPVTGAGPILYGNVAALIDTNVDYNDTGIANAVAKFSLHADAAHPVLVEVSAEVVTAFNAGTTNVLTVGTSTTANELLAAADITEGTPGFYPSGAGTGKIRITADTTFYVKYTQTGTAATTGLAKIYFKVTPLYIEPTI